MRFIMLLTVCLVVGTGCDAARDNGATVTVYDHGDARVHAYTTPESFVGNGVYLIEGQTSLIAIDTGFGSPVSADVVASVAELGKPVSRVIITHDHPDHWMNLGDTYPDAPAYSTAGTIAALEVAGRPTFDGFGAQLGPVAPVNFRIPTEVLPADGETLDGIEFTYEIVLNAEAEEQVIIRLPQLNTIFTGDLVYNGYHLVLTGRFDGWLAQLEALQADALAYVMPGHGAPTDASVYARDVEYLQTGRRIFGEHPGDPGGFVAALDAAYPDALGGDLLLGLSVEYLYPE